MSFPTIRKAVIPIAGWGTRMFPASKAVPKALFPMVDKDGFCKPIIQIIIEEALSALGSDGEVCIVVQDGQEGSRNPEPIRRYFSDAANEAYSKKQELVPMIHHLADIGSRLRFAYQRQQEGYGHAVLCAKDFVGNEPFLVLLGDHVYTTTDNTGRTCAQQLVDIYNDRGKSVTSLDTCPEAELYLNGIVSGRLTLSPIAPEHQLMDMEFATTLYDLNKAVEKPTVEYARENLKCEGVPEGHYMCFFGIDLLAPRIMEILQHNYDNGIRTKGELQLRDAMESLLKAEGMYGLRMAGQRHDTGIPHEFAKTVAVFNELAIANGH